MADRHCRRRIFGIIMMVNSALVANTLTSWIVGKSALSLILSQLRVNVTGWMIMAFKWQTIRILQLSPIWIWILNTWVLVPNLADVISRMMLWIRRWSSWQMLLVVLAARLWMMRWMM